ncbi:arginine-glutamic acid dipeptide repeats protein [Abrus precatorius]|uniref:Arginine-glutamic acid dipeptide repeats protein n=1 Tax=Abrus precatorius TaxID=3816 RepID=A0A8B8KEE8_ABRPR|nr:arginine-glutamic acid dipeptide repeats protein [Abrus precatorius]
MAGKQVGGEGLSANMAGMSKNQLYDIMSQMKNLIEQNQQQARQILIQNPMLTKALFQAQIMLGMVQSPQVVPKVQPMASQNSQQSVQPTQQPNIQSAPLLPGHSGVQDQAGVSQTQIPLRKHQNQPSVPISSTAVPPMSHQSQPMAAHSLPMPQQPKGHLTPQVAPVSLPQSSQLPNIPPPSLHSSSQPLHPTQMPTVSSQLQQPLQAPGFPHMPLQPLLPSQIRPPSGPTFHPQYPPQMGANLGFQHAGAHNLPQSMFHPGTKPPASVGSTFPQGQAPLPSQQSSQSPYQVGNMPLGPDFGNQAGNAMQVDRGSSWMPGPSENLPHLSGPPSVIPGQMGAANQPLRPPALTPEMEKALLQQVMSLTPEQINLLPPEQRNQVLQLQQMLRQ